MLRVSETTITQVPTCPPIIHHHHNSCSNTTITHVLPSPTPFNHYPQEYALRLFDRLSRGARNIDSNRILSTSNVRDAIKHMTFEHKTRRRQQEGWTPDVVVKVCFLLYVDCAHVV